MNRTPVLTTTDAQAAIQTAILKFDRTVQDLPTEKNDEGYTTNGDVLRTVDEIAEQLLAVHDYLAADITNRAYTADEVYDLLDQQAQGVRRLQTQVRFLAEENGIDL